LPANRRPIFRTAANSGKMADEAARAAKKPCRAAVYDQHSDRINVSTLNKHHLRRKT